MLETEEPALLSLMKDLVDALGTLIAGHVRLARAELGDDARRLARRAALVALAMTLGLVGYAFACVAAALALAPRVGAPLAFLAVGGVHLAGGCVGLGVWLAREAPRPLDESLAALDETVQTVRAVAALSLDAEGESPSRAAGGALEGAVP